MNQKFNLPLKPKAIESIDPQGLFAVMWQRTILIAIPFGVLAYVLGIVLEGPSGQLLALEKVAYPLLALGLLCLEWMLIRDIRSLNFVVSMVAIGSGIFFLTKLVFLLFFAANEVDILHQMTETFFWTPVIFTVPFFVSEARVGRIAALVFTILNLGFSALYVAQQLLSTPDWGIIYAVAQLNLANIVFLALSYAFMSFKESYDIIKNDEQEARQLAHLDSLTKLPNRLALSSYLNDLTQHTRHQTPSFTLFFIDIDNFKSVNDSLGHEAGDKLLVAFAERLSETVREGDVLARLSGDEFVMVAKHVSNQHDARLVAERFMAKLDQPFFIQDKNLRVSASIGMAIYPEDGEDPKSLLGHADNAMYAVKQSGKNGFEVYSEALLRPLKRHRYLKRELQYALENDQFSLRFQPIYDLRSEDISRIETFVVWEHPHEGYISAGEFIPIAEESGLMIPLGRWILKEACKQAKKWRLFDKKIKITVNISPSQFYQRDFFDSVKQALQNSNLPSVALELEMTERVVLDDKALVADTLEKLNTLGVGIAIDDFGTGHSSLSYLRDWPIDTLKIDGSFVREITLAEGSPYSLALVDAIMSLAQRLQLKVVAESIETYEQKEKMFELGCHLGQGHYLGRPVVAAEIEDLIADQKEIKVEV